MKTVDNYVNNVYKGHNENMSLKTLFVKKVLKNKDIFIKDT